MLKSTFLFKKNVYPSFLFLVVLLGSQQLSAQTQGCLTTTNNIYFNQIGMYNGVPSYAFRDLNDRIENGGNTQCFVTLGGAGSCDIFATQGGRSEHVSGTLIRYGPTECPLNEFLLVVVALVFFTFRLFP